MNAEYQKCYRFYYMIKAFDMILLVLQHISESFSLHVEIQPEGTEEASVSCGQGMDAYGGIFPWKIKKL